MKKKLIIIAALFTLSLFVFGETKIGVINPQKVINSTIRGKQVKKKLEKLGEAKQAEMKSMEDQISKLKKELMSPALNAEAREKKAADLQAKETNLRRFAEDARNEFQKQYQKEMQTLYKEIMPIIDKIGKAKGFTLILDLSNSGISYFDKSIDVTDEVIKEYNLKYSPK